ncbi:hypothetical protein B0H14DRAFT_2579190 [Mycena olivaceomarginata]|nr:hypothetical protein B0H14DRAFT_2579190 [Mycena olivaceomarginata]
MSLRVAEWNSQYITPIHVSGPPVCGGRINWRRYAQIKNPPINPPVDRQSGPNIPLVCTMLPSLAACVSVWVETASPDEVLCCRFKNLPVALDKWLLDNITTSSLVFPDEPAGFEEALCIVHKGWVGARYYALGTLGIVSEIRSSSQNTDYQCQKHEIERYEEDGERNKWDGKSEISDIIQQVAPGDLERFEDYGSRLSPAADTALLKLMSSDEAAEGEPLVGSTPAACLGAEDGMPKTRTSPAQFAWETANIEAPLKDECAGLVAEGGLDALRPTAEYPGARGVLEKRGGWSIDLLHGLNVDLPQAVCLSSLGAVDMEGPGGGFLKPKITARKALKESKPIMVENRYFPTWFASGLDAEELLDNELIQDILP